MLYVNSKKKKQQVFIYLIQIIQIALMLKKKPITTQ